jgi:hypothetical protein
MSIIQNTIEDIKGLKWNGFHSALEVQLSNTSYLKMSFEERLTHLVKNEITERRNRKIRQLTSRSKLKYKQAFIEETDYRPSRNLDKSLLLTLIQNEWIERSQNIIISGARRNRKNLVGLRFGQQSHYGRVFGFLYPLKQVIFRDNAGQSRWQLSVLVKKTVTI